MSMPPGASSLVGTCVRGMSMLITQRCQRMLVKLTRLIGVVSSATAVSKALKLMKENSNHFRSYTTRCSAHS